MCPLRDIKINGRNEKIHLVRFRSHSDTESLTQEIKTSLPIFRDFFPYDKMWLPVYKANSSAQSGYQRAFAILCFG